jgi:hypothetical protein
MAANVYTTLSNTVVYTDKLQITTSGNAVTYQAYAVALGTSAAAGNIYSAPITIPANTIFEVYSGAGNKITVTGTPFTALELGTASSATAGVIGYGSI